MKIHTLLARSLLLLAPLAFTAGCAPTDEDASAEDTAEGSDAISVNQWTPNAAIPNQSSGKGPMIAAVDGSLYMVHASAAGNSLYWSKSSDGLNWANDTQIPNQLSASTPGLAGFNHRLYMFHSGNANPNEVWMSSLAAGGSTWTANAKLSFLSQGSPAIAAFNGKLYIIGVAPGTHQLWMSTMDTSETFTPQELLGGQYSATPVSLSVFNGKLYMAHEAGNGTGMVTNSFGGFAWGQDQPVHNGIGGHDQLSSHGPAIAAYGGVLHMLHDEPGSSSIWWSYSTDGLTWAPEIALPNQGMSGRATMAPLAFRLGMVHPAISNTTMYASSFQ